MAACGNTNSASGKDSTNETEALPVSENEKAQEKSTVEKTVDAKSFSAEALGMKVSLGNITVSNNKVAVDLSLENTTSDILNFYPDGGQAEINGVTLSAGMSETSGTIGGETKGGTKQSGKLEFIAPEDAKLDAKTIKNIKLDFGDVSSEDYLKTKNVTFNVPVK